MTEISKNRLAGEKSPYLQQHAHNPVDWFPWGQEAFEKACRENKPVFLSIGYSTCHWCHVMERESFEDPQVAALMNDTFVSIKVDREERPDIDAQYMAVCQMLTGSGGWPLTVIMTPGKRPFYAGTYFPRETNFGRIGMLDLIPRIRKVWEENPAQAFNAANQITDVLKQSVMGQPGNMPGETELRNAFVELSERFDKECGGFGISPKFPTPHNLLFLLRYWKRSHDPGALNMVEKTLQSMRRGGIFDQIGFGFHRYSTDREWLVPHFEKMLYDQALIVTAYLEAFQSTGKEEYARTGKEIFAYCLRDMKSPEGVFYSAEDADSEGQEGRFYLWDYDEIKQSILPDEALSIIEAFNVVKNGNFKDAAGTMPEGSNILYMEGPFPAGEQGDKLKSGSRHLLELRNKRVHPAKDTKVLTDWNGLMIAALASGARVLEREEYAAVARRAAGFILDKMITGDGRLLHRYLDGEAAIPATINDYAFMIHGLIELYETTFDTALLKAALDLNRDMIEHFEDKDNGGFYLTADDAEELLARQKEAYDGAIPSSNSMIALNLLKLARITGNPELEQKARRTLQAFSREISLQPSAHTQMLMALDFAVGPSREIVISGQPDSADTMEMIKSINARFIPNKVVVLVPANGGPSPIYEIAPFTSGQIALEGKATAYVCINNICSRPTTDRDTMLKLIDSSPGGQVDAAKRDQAVPPDQGNLKEL